MTVKLEILWDGSVPGLSAHRVSLSSFGKALDALLQAFQQTARGIMHEAFNVDPGGNLLDVQLSAIQDGCARVQSVITPIAEPSGQLPMMLRDLEITTVIRFLEALESESRKEPLSDSVRKYLRALPVGLSRQRYLATNMSGEVIKESTIGEMDLCDPPRLVPTVGRYVGAIVGVGFEPGRPSVRIKPEQRSRPIDCEANQAQVEKAYGDLRGRTVEAMIVTRPVNKTPRHKLVWIREYSPERTVMSDHARMEYLGNRWKGTLAILAKSAGED